MLAKVLGGVKQAIFASQLLYWHGKGKRADGFIWKTQEEWTEETGLSPAEQRTARKRLVKMGILEEQLKGVPATLHYRLDLEILETFISSYQEPSQLDVKNLDNKLCSSPPTIPEITPETTSQNTDTGRGATAPPPPEPEPEPAPVKEEAPKAINAYRAIFHSYPRRETWGFIVTAVGERPDRLQTWARVCTEWLLRGYNKYNVRGLIDCFHKGGVETRGNGRHDGAQGGSFIDRRLALAAEEGMSGD